MMKIQADTIPWETCTCSHCGNGTLERVYGLGMRAMRMQAGLGLREVARHPAVNVSASYLSDMELGRRNMPEKVARAIAGLCRSYIK